MAAAAAGPYATNLHLASYRYNEQRRHARIASFIIYKPDAPPSPNAQSTVSKQGISTFLYIEASLGLSALEVLRRCAI